MFSDKTGTLTCNVMEFRKFSAGRHAYGTNDTVDQGKQEANVNFVDPSLFQVLDQ